MNQYIKELSIELHALYEHLMVANPWDEGYGEVVAIHEHLLRVLRDKAHTDYNEFKIYLAQTAKEIEVTWSSNSSLLSQWSEKLKPVFEKVELIISNAVPLLKLL